jgi:ribosomal protein L22
VITKKEFQTEARILLQPLDVEDLVSRKILVKEGAWYRVLKFKALTKHAFTLISEIAQDSRGTKIKFMKVSKKASAKLKKVLE